MNNTTTITLNDRFSMFKSSVGVGQPQQRGRARSRSRSRGRVQPQRQQMVDFRGSQRNRKLLDQLDKQHKMRMALKLKNKSILTSRGRAQGQIIRTGARRAATIKKAVNVRNMRRANSLTTFVPLNDGPRRNMRGRSRSRSQSRNRAQQQPVSITERLGARQPRRPMRRGPSNGAQQQQTQRSRSRPRSRVRLNRNNFNGNQIVRNGNSQVRTNGNNRGNSQARANGNKRGNSQARANSSRRANSINARLGNKGQGQIRRRNNVASVPARRRGFGANKRNANTQLKKPLAGRIVKKNLKPIGARVQRNQRQPGNALRANARQGNMVKRGNAPPQARGRANNRGANNGQTGQGSRRGRSRTRRGGAANGNNKRGIELESSGEGEIA